VNPEVLLRLDARRKALGVLIGENTHQEQLRPKGLIESTKNSLSEEFLSNPEV
jgi:hypothetical protein